MIYTKKPKKETLNTQMGMMNALLNKNDNWSIYATNYKLFACENYPTTRGNREIYISTREGMNGTRWVVFMDGWTLGKDLNFHYEPIPSSRDDEYLNNTRFQSKENALEALKAHINNLNGEQGVLKY